MNAPQADPPPSTPHPGVLDRALALVEFLRAGCAWDAAQTPHSLRRYLLEESHEVVDAIDRGDETGLRDELGDLLLNLAFQVVLAEERDAFGRDEVVAGLERKMRRRHPQLYGEGVPESWERHKARERGERVADTGGLLTDLAPTGDALADAHRLQERVSTVGFDWADPRGAWEKVREETEEVGAELDGGGAAHRLEEELGDLLFSVVNLTRLCGVHAPTALNRANRKFTRRFEALEALAARRGVELSSAGLAKLDLLWDEAKRGGE